MERNWKTLSEEANVLLHNKLNIYFTARMMFYFIKFQITMRQRYRIITETIFIIIIIYIKKGAHVILIN